MSKNQIKVLVVDDSALMRQIIVKMLESDPLLKVVNYARNGEDALAKIKTYKPDVVTMDVEMPELCGISALKRIMRENPVPVVMLSSLTTAGASKTLEALSLGAVDFVAKPANNKDLPRLASELIETVKAAAQISVKKISSICSAGGAAKAKPPLRQDKDSAAASKTVAAKPLFQMNTSATNTSIALQPAAAVELIVIGISTGGPVALQALMSKIPKNIPCGIVIAQHMPKGFTEPLAKRLNDLCEIEVIEGKDGDMVLPGRAIVAPAGFQLTFTKKADGLQVSVGEYSPIKTFFKPSVDVTVLSAAEVLGSKVLGVIMTGMGSDGALGLKSLKDKKGLVLAQDEESCIVYGMPRAVVEAGIADKVLPLSELGNEITSIASRR